MKIRIKKYIKNTVITLLVGVFTASPMALEPVSAQSPWIEIGLTAYKQQNEITFGGGNLYFGDSGNNRFLVEDVSGSFSVATGQMYLVVFGIYPSLESAQRDNNANQIPVYLGDNTWSLGLKAQTETEARNMKDNYVDASLVYPTSHQLVIGNDAKGIHFIYQGIGSMSIENSSGITTVLSTPYRGKIKLHMQNGKINAVNELPLESYLYSVVPSEMPALWHMEALKAQATTARTYAKRQLNAHRSEGFDLCDRVHCQMYLGVNNEHIQSTEAVNSTGGLVIYHNNILIDAVFSSSSGGVTDNSEDVWNEAVPYLRSTVDPYDITGKAWTRVTTLSEISKSLETHGYQIGKLEKMTIIKSANGRVKEINFVGSGGIASVEKEKIRTVFNGIVGGSLESRYFSFGYPLSPSGQTATTDFTYIHIANDAGVVKSETKNLPNNLFMQTELGLMPLEQEILLASITVGNREDSQLGNQHTLSDVVLWEREEVVISGKGWGHGVGMSQHGAKGMAEAGFSFDEIVRFYYAGVEIR